MLTFINEELFSFSTKVEEVDKKNGKTYNKIRVMTSQKIQQYKERQERDTGNNGKNKLIVKNDKLIPVQKEILKISTFNEEINSIDSDPDIGKFYNVVNLKDPMSINIKYINKYEPNIDIRIHKKGEDNANIYIIAFPFNGMIKPIKEDKKYRIYKGLIVPSAKFIFINNRKYRKIFYFVIEVNKNLFNKDHPYHTDEVILPLDSYGLFTDRESGQKKTNHETATIHFLPNGDYKIEWKYEEINDSIMMNVAPGEKIWPTFYFKSENKIKNDNKNTNKFNKNNSNNKFKNKKLANTNNTDKSYKDNNSNNKSENNFKVSDYKFDVSTQNTKKSSKNNKNRPITIEGNTLITTNKHGIRKEIPLNNRTRDNGGYNKSYKSSGKFNKKK